MELFLLWSSSTCSPAIIMTNLLASSSCELSLLSRWCMTEREKELKWWSEVKRREVQGETERLHKDLRSPNSSCPARSAPAWLTGLPGSQITSRCAVAKPTGKFPLSPSVASFVFLLMIKKKKLTTVLVKADVILLCRTFKKHQVSSKNDQWRVFHFKKSWY